MQIPRPWFVAPTLITMTLTGCVSPGSGETPAIARYEPSGEGGNMALLEGTILIRDGCLVIESEGDVYLPVFATSDIGPESFEDGQSAALTGGFVPDASSSDADIPGACAELNLGTEMYYVAQPD